MKTFYPNANITKKSFFQGVQRAMLLINPPVMGLKTPNRRPWLKTNCGGDYTRKTLNWIQLLFCFVWSLYVSDNSGLRISWNEVCFVRKRIAGSVRGYLYSHYTPTSGTDPTRTRCFQCYLCISLQGTVT